MAKQNQIKSQSAGAYFTAIIEKEKYTIKPDSDARTLIKKEIAAYNVKNDDKRLAKIKKLLKPKEEKKKQDVLVLKKQVKNSEKNIKKGISEKNIKKGISEKSQAITEVVVAVEEIVLQKEEVKVEQIQKVAELAKHLRYIGYIHPVTGLVWDGEKYK